jgi:hypothetical protein
MLDHDKAAEALREVDTCVDVYINDRCTSGEEAKPRAAVAYLYVHLAKARARSATTTRNNLGTVDHDAVDHDAAEKALDELHSLVVDYERGVRGDESVCVETIRDYIAGARELAECRIELETLRTELARVRAEHMGQQAKAWREGYGCGRIDLNRENFPTGLALYEGPTPNPYEAP